MLNYVKNPRPLWIRHLEKLSRPVLAHLAAQTLRASMPIEAQDITDREPVMHLEAVARLLAGIAPWLECGFEALSVEERALQAEFRSLAVEGLIHALDPASPDHLNFNAADHPQVLVDTAFLAHALLRAPNALLKPLVEQNESFLVDALTTSMDCKPPRCNWLLFPAMIEALLDRIGVKTGFPAVREALEAHESWYLGDGTYGDGPELHHDYYNSYVISPMILDVLDAVGDRDPSWGEMRPKALSRAQRYAEVLERMVAPDGTYPPLGRSITYRCGAFQLLAQLSLQRRLPDSMAPGQAATALTAVINRTLECENTYDQDGWLRIGLAGHQPSLGEHYISTGSLYLCATAFLPLGLPPHDPFWAQAQPTTQQQIWSGNDASADLPPSN